MAIGDSNVGTGPSYTIQPDDSAFEEVYQAWEGSWCVPKRVGQSPCRSTMRWQPAEMHRAV
jgi:hypothetical protein